MTSIANAVGAAKGRYEPGEAEGGGPNDLAGGTGVSGPRRINRPDMDAA
jgi:hypothetical protein